MSSLWTTSCAESGILRKNDHRDKLEDLLVFGYACKLFRDDEKALDIDQGKHLIPWMTDNTLKIDRYDGRGALSDLKPFESSKEGYDAMRWLGLSESERKIEQLCDEERYFAMNTNEEEDELYKEEELKRSHNQSNQIQYSYEEAPKTEGPSLQPEEDDEPFIAPPELDIPVNMTLPSTVKQNARIEKTALFISREGPQMEILLKTKQAGNAQFAFLTQDDQLYRYYRHVLMAIKTGRYYVRSENAKFDNQEKQEEGHYLHPSLAPVAFQSDIHSGPVLPPLTYKPSADCAYSQLVTRIQGALPAAPEPAPAVSFGYQSYANPYMEIVSKVKGKEEGAALQEPSGDILKAPVVYNTAGKVAGGNCGAVSLNMDGNALPTHQAPQTSKNPQLFSLAAYSGSDSDSENDDAENSTAQAVVVPPPEIQIIIDKMASYVAKNGADFEAIVRSKGDQRFVFLEGLHPFHPYYKYKLKICLGNGAIQPQQIDEPMKRDSDKLSKQKEKKIITPVCFSIKKPRDSEAVPRDKSALPVEDSTDEDDPTSEEKDAPLEDCLQPLECAPEVKESQEDKIQSNVIEVEDSIMELIDLTQEFDEKKDKKAEDRLKDKLAAAAREKLAAKNRALQMERKKRAAAFLSQLKPQQNSIDATQMKIDLEETKTVRCSPPDSSDLQPDDQIMEDLSRVVYHIEAKAPGMPDRPSRAPKGHRSRSTSRHRPKASHHRRKSRKRSHSHSRKRKREKRPYKKKAKRKKSQSRSRSLRRTGSKELESKRVRRDGSSASSVCEEFENE